MNKQIDNRQIRIFISSTFQDMQLERDYLITKVFPRLQTEAVKRNVTIVPIDLRWGITEEEAHSGKVIQICLQEIENSHPFFIGLIGDRYGWCPSIDTISKNEILKERWGEWLENDFNMGLSITEIEMQYGVLRSKEPMNAFFYIKRGNDKTEVKNSKLGRLKTTIRNNGRYPVSDYESPEDLGAQVEESFRTLLNKLYPNVESLSRLEKERQSQNIFLYSCTKNYISVRKNYEALDCYLNNQNQHAFVITGESGMGKSSLIANWILRSKQNENINIIYHFIGNSNDEGDYCKIQEHLIDEICDMYCLSDCVVGETLKDKLQWLYTKITRDKQLVIVLDGVNQLFEPQAKLLNWLPVPQTNVKYIFSTVLGDSTMDVFESKNCPMLILNPLSHNQKEELVRNYLSTYCKSLTFEQVNRIISDKKNNNTFVLRTLLNELVNFGSHEKLDSHIDSYLEVNDIHDFFQRVLIRFEQDYGVASIGLFLSYIVFSYKGVSEAEILKMAKVPTLVWSQFYCAFSPHLINHNGLICISHQYMKDAILRRYKNKEQQARQTLIAHFKNEKSYRANEELSYQYAEVKDYDSLYKLLMDYAVFESLLNVNKSKLIYYWNLLRSIDSKKYSLSVYGDSRYIAQTSKTRLVNYQIIGDFALEYFSEKDFAHRCYKLNELEHNNFAFMGNDNVSPQSLYRCARTRDNVDEVIYYLDSAIRNCGYETWKKNNKISNIFVYGDDIVSCLIDIYLFRGEMFTKKHEYESANQSFKEAFWIVSSLACEDVILKCKFYRTYSSFAKIIGDVDLSLKMVKSAYELSHELPYERLLSASQFALFLADSKRENSKQKDNQQEITLVEEILKLSNVYWVHESEEYAYAMKSIAKIYLHLHEFDKSMEYIEKAKHSYTLLHGAKHHSIAECYSIVGDIYKYRYSHNELNYESKLLFVSSRNNYNGALSIFSEQQFKEQVEIRYKLAELYSCADEDTIATLNEAEISDAFLDIHEFCSNCIRLVEIEGYDTSQYKLLLEKVTENYFSVFSDYEVKCYRKGESFYQEEKYEQAIQEFEKSLNALKMLFLYWGEDPVITVPLHRILAICYCMLNDYDRALQHCKSTIEVVDNKTFYIEDIRKDLDLVLSTIVKNVTKTSNNYINSQMFMPALKCELLIKDAYGMLYDNEDENTATNYSNIGFCYEKLGNYDLAIEYYLKSVNIYIEKCGSINFNVADLYCRLGKIHENKEQYQQAIYYYQKVYEIDYNKLGKKHQFVIKDKENLERVRMLNVQKNKKQEIEKQKEEFLRSAATYLFEEDYKKALDYFQKGIETINKEEYPSESDLVYCYTEIGKIYLKTKDSFLAISAIEKAFNICKEYRIADEEKRAHHLGFNSFNEALKSMKTLKRGYGTELECLELLIEAYIQTGDFENAFYMIEKMKHDYKIDENSYINLHKINGDIYLAQKLFSEALREYKNYYQATLKIYNGSEIMASEELALIAEVYRISGDYQEAINIYTKIYNFYNDKTDEDAVTIAYKIADIYEEMGMLSDALKIYMDISEAMIETYDADDEEYIIAINKIAHFCEKIGDLSNALMYYKKVLNDIKAVEEDWGILKLDEPRIYEIVVEASKNIERISKNISMNNSDNKKGK